MLILAGVTISVVINTGLIDNAKKAANASKLAQLKEQIRIDILTEETNSAIAGADGVSEDTIKNIVEKYGGKIDEENGNVVKFPDGEISLEEIKQGATIGSGLTPEAEEKIAQLENTIGDLNKTVDSLNQQLDTEKREKEELENRITNLNGQINNLNKELEDGQAIIQEKEGTINSLEEQLNTKKEELATEQANKATLEQTIANLNTQIDNLNKEIANKNKTIQEKQGTIDTLNGQITSKTEEIANKNKTIQQLEGTVSSLNTQVGNLNTQVNDLKKKQATGNATVAQVLSGATFSNASGVGLTGTMANKGAWNSSVGVGQSVTIPAGYHNGSGKVTANKATGTAEAGQVLTGYTFSNGSGLGINGNMPNRGALNWNPSSSATHTVQAGYYSGGTLNSANAYNAGYNAGWNNANVTSDLSRAFGIIMTGRG